jgi:TetR/AcrR family transcriptional regulator, hemagglutinin/protease regulatory protein
MSKPLAAKTSLPHARRLPPAQRKAQLLACAMRVFARHGLGAARHAQIAREVGVSVATVFFYFPTRDRLVGAVLREVERFYLAMLTGIRNLDLPAVQRLLLCGRGFADSVDSHPDHARVSLRWSVATQDKVWPRHIRFRDRVLRLLESIIREGQREGSLAANLDPEADALVLMGAAYTLAQLKLAGSQPERMNRFLNALVRAMARRPNLGEERPRGARAAGARVENPRKTAVQRGRRKRLRVLHGEPAH